MQTRFFKEYSRTMRGSTFKMILNTILFITVINQPVKACKLWAVCTSSGITLNTVSEQANSMIESQLSSFYYQSEFMLDGWSILGYEDSSHQETTSICRSSLTAPNDSSLYWETVQSLMGNERGVMGMGHLRVATSGSNSIPNPHPWVFQDNGMVFSLMHNGTVSKDLLHELLTENGLDPSWLNNHPPQTFDNGAWDGDGWGSVVDSELILLLVMKKIDLIGDIVEGFKVAMADIVNAGVNAGQLNIIFSDGLSLLVFGGSSGLHVNKHEEFISVMTQPTNDQNHQWQSLLHEELIYIDRDTMIYHQEFIVSDIDDVVITLPKRFKMSSAYPNPFNGSVSFYLSGLVSGPVNISIYSLMGQRVDRFSIPGYLEDRVMVEWSPSSGLASGTYFVHAGMNGKKETQKILFIK